MRRGPTGAVGMLDLCSLKGFRGKAPKPVVHRAYWWVARVGDGFWAKYPKIVQQITVWFFWGFGCPHGNRRHAAFLWGGRMEGNLFLGNGKRWYSVEPGPINFKRLFLIISFFMFSSIRHPPYKLYPRSQLTNTTQKTRPIFDGRVDIRTEFFSQYFKGGDPRGNLKP